MKKVRECWRRLNAIRRKGGNTKKERRERARDNDRMPLQELEQGGDLKVAATRAEHKNRLGNGRSKDRWDYSGPEENTGCTQVHCMSGRENRRGELDVLGCRGR